MGLTDNFNNRGEVDMPIYEFQCEACDHRFEKLLFRSDEMFGNCPECGAKQVKKLLSSPSATGLGTVLGGCAPGGRFS